MILVTLRSVIVMVVIPFVAVVVVAMTVVSVMTVPITLRATSVGVSDFGEVLGSGTDMKLFKHLIGCLLYTSDAADDP